jgi:hypothetical protein
LKEGKRARDERPSRLATFGRPSLSQTTDIIIVDIEKKYYIFGIVYLYWKILFELVCPACGIHDRFTKHTRYTKYYYAEELWILRLKCESCGTTHAVIPSFSLPDNSSGTNESEAYLIKRAKGVGRGTAGKQLLELGMSEKYLRQLDKQFQVCVDRAKALFPDAGQVDLDGMEWVRSVVGDTSRPLYALNCFCLEHAVNAVCCTRVSILRFSVSNAGRNISRNLGRGQKTPTDIHSP